MSIVLNTEDKLSDIKKWKYLKQLKLKLNEDKTVYYEFQSTRHYIEYDYICKKSR